MTDHTPTPGNTPGLPTPSIAEIHRTAVRLSGIMRAVAYLEDEGECKEGQSALIFLADEVALELEQALDTYNTREGRAA